MGFLVGGWHCESGVCILTRSTAVVAAFGVAVVVALAALVVVVGEILLGVVDVSVLVSRDVPAPRAQPVPGPARMHRLRQGSRLSLLGGAVNIYIYGRA